jgi:hypothetical protein
VYVVFIVSLICVKCTGISLISQGLIVNFFTGGHHITKALSVSLSFIGSRLRGADVRLAADQFGLVSHKDGLLRGCVDVHLNERFTRCDCIGARLAVVVKYLVGCFRCVSHLRKVYRDFFNKSTT